MLSVAKSFWVALTFSCCCACSSHRSDSASGASGSTGAAGSASAGAAGSGPTSPVEVSFVFPAPGASAVCADAPLRLAFSAAVTLGQAGKIQVFKAGAPELAVDSIDLAAQTFAGTIGGRAFQLNRPVFVDAEQAVIYLPSGLLDANESYFVSIDAGVFLDRDGNPLRAISDPSTWSFSTRALMPLDPLQLTVALDDSGDFCRVQSAVDFVPAANPNPVTISVKHGTYHEIVVILSKQQLTLRGESRTNTRIAYANNEGLNPGTARRALFDVENSSGFVLENITLHNLTPQGGGQAEAIRVEPSDQVILRHADFISLQDTLLLSGRVYVHDCYVEGNVDYIWGKGTAYFENCEFKTVARAGYQVQARNTANAGYVFVDSRFTADSAVSGHYLGRIEIDRFPASHVAYVNCQFGPHIAPLGWLVTNTGDASQLRFWEYQSTDLDGQPLDVSRRHAVSKQMSDEEAALMRDKTVVLGGWNPQP